MFFNRSRSSMPRVEDNTLHFTANEVVVLVGLVSNIPDPEIYTSDKIKAIIYKCKAAMQNDNLTKLVVS